MLLHPSGDTNDDALKEEKQARRRGMIPLKYQVEIKVNYAERCEECNTPFIISCERRGASYATSPGRRVLGSNRVLFDDSIKLHLLLFRKGDQDQMELERTELVSNGKALPGIEPVRARLTVRENGKGGEVADVAAIDLANYIVGAHGSVTEKIELQLGSVVELQVMSDIEFSLSESTPNLTCNKQSKDAQVDSRIPCFDQLESKEATESSTPPSVDTIESEESRTTPKLDNLPFCLGRKRSQLEASSFEETLDFDSELEQYLMSSMCSGHDETLSTVDQPGLTTKKTAECSSSEPVSISLKVSRRSTISENTVDDACNRGDDDDSVEMLGKTPSQQNNVKSNNLGKIINTNDLDEELLSIGANDENPADIFGREMSQREDSVEEESGSEDYEQRNRIVLPNHVLTPLVLSRTPMEAFSSFTDEGRWTESPMVTQIKCPMPITVWSIQGPEEIDPDEEDDMMEMEDGTLLPKRSIPKLQSAAAALDADSTTKASPPALPGNMSPLQRSYLVPTKVRQALYVALGKPLNLKTCTVLAASKRLHHNRIDVEDPSLTDSEEEDEGLDEEEEEGMNEAVSDNSGGFVVDCSDMDFIDQVAVCPKAVPSHSYFDDGSETSQKIRQNSSQTAELMNRINELEEETNSLRQMLKKSNMLVDDLQQERVFLKNLLDEHEGKSPRTESTPLAEDTFAASVIVSSSNVHGHQGAESEKMKPHEEQLVKEHQAAEEARITACHELEILQAEVIQENNLRLENERLLTVILSLKRELDREPGVPDVLDELKKTKSELTLERAKADSLQNELAQMQRHGSSSSPSRRKKSSFWSSSSSSQPKKQKTAGFITSSKDSDRRQSPRSGSKTEP